MKSFYQLPFLVIFLISFSTQSQSISPSDNSDYCPLTNITFTVTLPGTGYSFPNVTGWADNVPANVVSGSISAISISGGNSVFTFVGNFLDNNNTQAFRVSFTLGGQPGSVIFKYTKIRSFLTTVSESIIRPNLSLITALPCQSQNININFSNIQFANPSVTPRPVYSTTTVYEYSIPAGWTLNNGSPSTGPNDWKTGTSNVIITSGLANGGSVKIRPINSCGATLIKGPEVSVPIVRPKPPLLFSGNSTICSNQNFEASNVPSWATNFLWEVTPNSVATVINPTNNPATVQSVSSGFANIKLTISNPTCASFEYNTVEILNKPEIVVGTPSIIGIYYNPDFSTTLLQSGQSVCPGIIRAEVNQVQSTVYTWERIFGSASYITNGGIIDITLSNNENVSFLLTATNSCGSISRTINFTADNPDCGFGGGFFRFSASPNPANEYVTISSAIKGGKIKEIRIVEKTGRVKKRILFQSGIQNTILSLSGLTSETYYIQIYDGTRWYSKTLLIQK
jgi:hypothetical protein